MTVRVSDRGPVRLLEMHSPPVNALGSKASGAAHGGHPGRLAG